MKHGLKSKTDINQLKEPYIFDKYGYDEFWDSSPIELFNEFKKFYLTLNKEVKL